MYRHPVQPRWRYGPSKKRSPQNGAFLTTLRTTCTKTETDRGARCTYRGNQTGTELAGAADIAATLSSTTTVINPPNRDRPFCHAHTERRVSAWGDARKKTKLVTHECVAPYNKNTQPMACATRPPLSTGSESHHRQAHAQRPAAHSKKPLPRG